MYCRVKLLPIIIFVRFVSSERATVAMLSRAVQESDRLTFEERFRNNI